MPNCVNCGKKINSLLNYYTDPFSSGNTCKACAQLLNSLIPTPVTADYELAQQREQLIENGITESGLAYISEQMREVQERAAAKDARAQEEAAILAKVYEEKEARLSTFRRDTPDENGLYYHMEGARGRELDVYYDKCVITTNVTLGSIIAQNATDGEKTIYYMDCVGVQFKKSAATIGYLQLETASVAMNNKSSNFFHENSFTFESALSADANGLTMNEKMEVVADFIKKRIEEIKLGKNTASAAPALSTASIVEELKSLKELVDLGILTQEEFDAKKKQLLGL